MPPRYREALMQGIILTQGTPDRCIRAYPGDAFDEQAQLFMNDPVTKRSGRVMRRAFFSGAFPAELDRAGRVLIPPQLRQWANLETQVTVVGAGEGIEIWNADDFETAIGAEQETYLQSLESE